MLRVNQTLHVTLRVNWRQTPENWYLEEPDVRGLGLPLLQLLFARCHLLFGPWEVWERAEIERTSVFILSGTQCTWAFCVSGTQCTYKQEGPSVLIVSRTSELRRNQCIRFMRDAVVYLSVKQYTRLYFANGNQCTCCERDAENL